MKRDFSSELTKQLRFLTTSCAEYDRGNQDEGVRIAVILAVLFHDTGKSQSLLAHLKLKRIRLLSTSSMMTFAGIGNLTTLKIDVATGDAQFYPNLGASLKRFVPFDAWWNHEMIFRKESQNVCRRHLVLAARNKDGGAHVDSCLEPSYEWLVSRRRGGLENDS